MGFYPININRVPSSCQARFVRSGALEVQERDSTNATVRETTWGLNLGGGIGGLLAILSPGSGLLSPVYDGKGNVSAVLDDAQASVAAYGYDEFGVLQATIGSLDQPFRFSTKSYDPQTGLAYFGYRFYSPGLGRWLNRDPIGEKGGLNLYAFVGNNPVSTVDPDGLIAYTPLIGGGMALINGTLATIYWKSFIECMERQQEFAQNNPCVKVDFTTCNPLLEEALRYSANTLKWTVVRWLLLRYGYNPLTGKPL